MHLTWENWLSPVLQTDQFNSLLARVQAQEDSGVCVLPDKHLRFRAFQSDPLSIKVVILGQDPYPTPGHAMGLAFSVNPGVSPPRSLCNIYKEIQTNGGRPASGRDGDLTHWEEQGVLLLNTVLTVVSGTAHAHAGWGWEDLTQLALHKLSHHHPGLVFILWGGPAQKAALKAGVDTQKHLCLASAHPSPLSAYRGFFGCNHFNQANSWLVKRGHDPIDW